MCYKSEQEGRYLYIIDGALSAFNYGQVEDGAAPGAGGVDGGVAPVPPCIQHTSTGTVRVAVELDDRARARAVTKITADGRRLAADSSERRAGRTPRVHG